MNLIIIGGRNPQKLSDIIYSSFDDMAIACYSDINGFMEAISIRAIDVHRMLLLQDGVDSVSDEELYRFADLVQTSYPAMKLITLCKDLEMVKFMAELFPGGNSAHFCASGLKAKMIVDLVSLDINVLNKKYENLRYKVEHVAEAEVVDDVIFNQPSEINNEDVPGYIAPKTVEEPKRGFISRVFGLHPKKKNNKLVSDGNLKNIGQGIGVDEFSQAPESIDNMQEDMETDDGVDYTIFGAGMGGDVGLGLENPMHEETDNTDKIHKIFDEYSHCIFPACQQ